MSNHEDGFDIGKIEELIPLQALSQASERGIYLGVKIW